MSTPSQNATTNNHEMFKLLLLIVVVVAAFGFLPAVFLGLVLNLLIRRASRARRPWYWGAALLIALVGCLLLWRFADLETAIVVYARAWIHDLETGKWANTSQLVSVTSAVWLKTLVTAPIFSLVFALDTSGQADEALKEQVRGRHMRLARASHRAAKRTRDPERVPEVLGGQIVLGVPLSDPDDHESW